MTAPTSTPTDAVEVTQVDREADLDAAKAWLCKRGHQDYPNTQHIIQLADYAAYLRLAAQPAPGGVREDESIGCDADRKAWGELHRVQHDPATIVKPRLGGYLVAWAAEEIRSLRAALAATTPAADSEGGINMAEVKGIGTVNAPLAADRVHPADGGRLVYMTCSGGYVMVRRPRCASFVMSHKDWRKLAPYVVTAREGREAVSAMSAVARKYRRALGNRTGVEL